MIPERSAPDTPGKAETAFYSAFENGDVAAMEDIWAHTDSVVCIHPHAPRLMGYDEVMQSWRDILRNTAGFRISVQMLHHYTDEEVSVHFVNEVLIDESSRSQPVTILTTNAYHKTDSGWRMILHHASPAPASSDESEEEDDTDQVDGNVTLH